MSTTQAEKSIHLFTSRIDTRGCCGIDDNPKTQSVYLWIRGSVQRLG